MQHDSTPTTIELRPGLVVTIDAGDIDIVMGKAWHISRCSGRPDYVVTSSRVSNRYLHRMIMDAPKGNIVDHANGDTFDNRRSNLRFSTHQQNMSNSRKRRGNSGYKGVKLRCDGKKWTARIQVDRKGIHLGSFTSQEDAARAYDAAAILHFGEFARLNFPLQIVNHNCAENFHLNPARSYTGDTHV